ncbi:Ig-like domain-containing protein [Lysobacter arvi]|uniref:Ig-like domain-containing protein n=1 Tax=Lysobacter arvi TaxID=3038776 RepID=A0ABU1CC51_9GAMM|nr:Ig-like domain-containing protein [Lysobacter arvi]MDR0181745.1 Ig-like domain-containing protein [Lysobacter arvi]
MQSEQIQILIANGRTPQRLTALDQGVTAFEAVVGATYRLVNRDTGAGSEIANFKRTGKDLEIFLEGFGGKQPDALIRNFFGSQASIAGLDANAAQQLGQLPDGAAARYSMVAGSSAPLGATASASVVNAATLGAQARAGDTVDTAVQHAYQVVSPVPPTFRVWDDVGASTGLLMQYQKTDDTRPTLNGHGKPGDILRIYVNDAQVGTAQVRADGSWFFTPANPLAEGTQTFTVATVDAAGREIARSAPYAIVIESAGPVVPDAPVAPAFGIHDDVGASTGLVAPNQNTDDTQPTVSGRGRPGDTIHVYANGNELGYVVVADNGMWSFTPAAALAAGPQTFTVVAVDAAGRASAPSAPYTIVIESAGPVVPDAPVAPAFGIHDDVGASTGPVAPNQNTDDTQPTLSGHGRPGDAIHVYANGNELGYVVVADNGMWSFTPATALATGPQTFTVVAVDAAGRASAPSAPYTIVIGTAPAMPTLTIDAIAGDDVLDTAEAASLQTISGSATGPFKAGDTVTFMLNGHFYSAALDASGHWSAQVAGADLAAENRIYATLMGRDGNGDVVVLHADRAYRFDPTPSGTTLTIDTVAGDDVLNAAEAAAQQVIAGKVVGQFTAGDLVTFTLNGTTYSAAVSASGDWHAQVAGADLAKGTSIDATLVAHDAAGNGVSVTASRAYTVDTSAPMATLTIDAIANDDVLDAVEAATSQTVRGKVTGEFTPGDIVSFTLNDHLYSAIVDASGAWRVTVPGADLATATGIHATLMAHDAAGNIGAITADRAYTLDLVAGPTTLTINTVAGDDVVDVVEGAAEQTISGTVTGQFIAGDIVSFTLNDHAYSAAVDASGFWSVAVAGTDLLQGNSINATLVAHDGAGNATIVTGNRPYTLELAPPTATLTIVSVAGDDIVSAAEASGAVNITGTSTGARAGDVVTLTINGKQYSTTVDESGLWTMTGVPGSDLAADADATVEGTLRATDVAGNATDVTSSHAYTVVGDVPALTATVSISRMTKDSGVSQSDWLTNNGDAGRLISGTIAGKLNTGDKVQVSTDGGITWQDAYVSPLSGNHWHAMDINAHRGDWTILARVVDSDGTAGPIAWQAVTLDTMRPNAVAEVVASADNGLTVGLEGYPVVAGDILDLQQNGRHVQHVLTAAEVAAKSVTIALPQGMDPHALSISTIDQAGNISQAYRTAQLPYIGFEGTSFNGAVWQIPNSNVTVMAPGGMYTANAANGVQEGETSLFVSQQDPVRFDLGQLTRSVSFRYGSNNDENAYVAFYDATGHEIGREALALGVNEVNFTVSPITNAIASFTIFAPGSSDYAAIDAITIDAGASWAAEQPLAQTIVSNSSDYYGTEVENVFRVADAQVLGTTGVHGNGGTDTLMLTGSGQTLTANALIGGGKLDGVEVLDITGTGNNTLDLTIGDVLSLGKKDLFVADGHVQLMVQGNAGDVLELGDLLPDGVDPGNWAKDHVESIGGIDYDVYRFATTNGSVFNNVEVFVTEGVLVDRTHG